MGIFKVYSVKRVMILFAGVTGTSAVKRFSMVLARAGVGKADLSVTVVCCNFFSQLPSEINSLRYN